MEESKELEVFRSAPVPQAVLKTTIPAMRMAPVVVCRRSVKKSEERQN
ncbi:MAG: hypothetical protein IKO91_00710 [Oscillospiraceae bacterium]|nr:hypothetical protein [Oscillospiraceae bacterium]